jgi:hypothetical protein
MFGFLLVINISDSKTVRTLIEYRDLAAIGALVIVLSLAADPFLQTVVSFNGRLDGIVDSDRSRIAKTERWAAGEVVLMSSSVGTSTLTYQS